MKYSLFLLEREVYKPSEIKGYFITEKCMEYVDTFDTLEEAYDHSVHILEKTIILPSY